MSKTFFTARWFVLILLFSGYSLLAIFWRFHLQSDLFQSDARWYWEDSLAWQTPFQPFHVPGYPLLLALLRGATFGIPTPIQLMMGINLVALLCSGVFVYELIRLRGVAENLAVFGALLFGLWPFVGLVYSVYPIADLPAIFFLLLGLYLLQRSRRLTVALFLGLSMLTHKTMWLVVGLIIFTDWIQRRDRFSLQMLLFVGIAFLPLGVLWLDGASYHNSFVWMFSESLNVEIASRSQLPLLDGIVGTFIVGGAKGMIKGCILLLSAGLAFLIFLLDPVKNRDGQSYDTRALSLSVLILFITLNQNTIWAAVRFSSLLAIPLTCIIDVRLFPHIAIRWYVPMAILILTLSFLSQYAYAWYIARVYFA